MYIMSLFDFFKKKTSPKEKESTKSIINENITTIKGNVNVENLKLTQDIIENVKRRFIAIDFETTGLSPYNDRIIEIGAVIFENDKIISRFGTLVNPGIDIPMSATKVNHITNEMVVSAPNESTAITDLVEFIGNAIDGETCLCAHNARFDSGFLAETLKRNGFNASLKFIDTLNVARKNVYGLENYRQDTLAQYFGIVNCESHRALSDAEVCGSILIRLNLLAEEKIEKQAQDNARAIEISTLTEEQRAWSAYIQKNFVQKGFNIDLLSFQRRSGNYLDCACLYTFLRIKFGKKKYVIAKKQHVNSTDYNIEPCVASEGGDEFVRVLFNSPFELDSFMPYIIKEYLATQKTVQHNLREGYIKEQHIPEYMRFSTVFKNDELDDIIDMEKERIHQKRIEEIEKEKIKEEKRVKKEQRNLEKQKNESIPKRKRTRPIIKLDDNGTILEEFESISEAVNKTGINSKSIRDAANGVQKHAGGFCWRYKETTDTKNDIK